MKHEAIDAVFNRSLPLDSSAFLSLGLLPISLRLEYVRIGYVLAARNVLS